MAPKTITAPPTHKNGWGVSAAFIKKLEQQGKSVWGVIHEAHLKDGRDVVQDCLICELTEKVDSALKAQSPEASQEERLTVRRLSAEFEDELAYILEGNGLTTIGQYLKLGVARLEARLAAPAGKQPDDCYAESVAEAVDIRNLLVLFFLWGLAPITLPTHCTESEEWDLWAAKGNVEHFLLYFAIFGHYVQGNHTGASPLAQLSYKRKMLGIPPLFKPLIQDSFPLLHSGGRIGKLQAQWHQELAKEMLALNQRATSGSPDGSVAAA